jgi:hypothetical protein
MGVTITNEGPRLVVGGSDGRIMTVQNCRYGDVLGSVDLQRRHALRGAQDRKKVGEPHVEVDQFKFVREDWGVDELLAVQETHATCKRSASVHTVIYTKYIKVCMTYQ